MIEPLSMSFRVFTAKLLDIPIFEPRHEKTNVLVSHMVRHKPGITATEDG